MKERFDWDAERFIEDLEKRIVPLSERLNIAEFNATVSGEEEEFRAARDLHIKLCEIYSNRNTFEILKRLYKEISSEKPLIRRQMELMYNEFSGYQFGADLINEIINLSTNIEKIFSTHRVKYNEKRLTDNEIDDILLQSTDSAELEKVWRASKEIGSIIEKDLLTLIRLRNKGAQSLGYDNFHQMSLELAEQTYSSVDALFSELNILTMDSYKNVKAEIDEYLSKRFKIPIQEIMPWHYQDKFFQTGPKIFKTDLDKYFQGKDVVKVTQDYFNRIGLNIDDILNRSDLFEKTGKYQHAYCTNIDRNGDIRVVCNVKQNYKWMATLLHEFGHAVYDKYVSPKLPWQLRRHAHIFVTEGIAMMFGRFAADLQWLRNVMNVGEEEINRISGDCFNILRHEQLIFSRWVQVMYNFEKVLYQNPDQNLNELWWDLVEEFQMIKRPRGGSKSEWAAKIHLAVYPAYYHNYMLGEILASQLYYFIINKVLAPFGEEKAGIVNNKRVGKFLIDKIFSKGAQISWNDLIKTSLEEELSPKYYARQFLRYDDN